MKSASLPKVEFRYSWIYDWRNEQGLIYISKHDKSFKKTVKEYPSPSAIKKTVLRYQKIWRKYEKVIPKEISRTYGLSWRQEIIYCYVVGASIPFSEPMTIPVYKSDTRFVDILTHEMVHQIEFENLSKVKNLYNWINRKYEKETVTTRYHITVHAIHEHIYRKLFGVNRLNANVAFNKRYPDYRKAWEIVQKEGYKQLIKKFRARV